MENNEAKKGNLVNGLRMLRTSNILAIVAAIAAVAGGIALIVGAVVGAGVAMESKVESIVPLMFLAVAGIGGVIALAGIVISVVSAIMGVVALVKLGGSHSGYKIALIFVIAGMAFTIASGFFSVAAAITAIFSAVSLIFAFLVVYFVINATVSLLREKGDQATAAQGERVRKIYIICTAAAVVVQILGACPFLTTFAAVLGGILMVASIVEVVALFKFIGFLRNSANSLGA